MLSLLDRGGAVESSGLRSKLEGIGFGVFIPIFFVVSGVQLNLSEGAAAGLGAGGVLSVLLFPALALGPLRKETA